MHKRNLIPLRVGFLLPLSFQDLISIQSPRVRRGGIDAYRRWPVKTSFCTVMEFPRRNVSQFLEIEFFIIISDFNFLLLFTLKYYVAISNTYKAILNSVMKKYFQLVHSSLKEEKSFRWKI